MTRLVKVLGVAALLIAGVAVAKQIYPSATLRYKMTVEIDTSEGIKSGSSVYEMTNTDPNIKLDLPEAGNPATIRGEAIVVDLGKRGIVFGLIPSEHVLYSAISVPGGGATTPKGIRYYKNLNNAKATLKINEYPIMVAFKDIKDPKSVELVYQSEAVRVPNQMALDYKITDNFETLLGKGVKLKNITIEMTDEVVTWDVGKYLVWLGQYYDQRLDGERFGTIESKYRLANSLSAGSFSTGEVKNEQ